jgi:hypothetical protein
VALDSNVSLWATATSTHESNGRKVIYRFARAFNSRFEHRLQPVRIIIVWRYQSVTGQPNAEDHQRMNQMEDLLESALDKASFATLAIVSTGENLREWTYYSRSEDEFMARLNFALTDSPRFPIEIHIAHDPDWETYAQFVSSMKKELIN